MNIALKQKKLNYCKTILFSIQPIEIKLLYPINLTNKNPLIKIKTYKKFNKHYQEDWKLHWYPMYISMLSHVYE